MSVTLKYMNPDETFVATPADADALYALLHGIYAIRKRLGSTAFNTAAAAATTVFDAESLAVGTVAMLTGFGAQ